MRVARSLVYCSIGITLSAIFSHVFFVDACLTTRSVDEVTLGEGGTTPEGPLEPGETTEGTTAVRTLNLLSINSINFTIRTT